MFVIKSIKIDLNKKQFFEWMGCSTDFYKKIENQILHKNHYSEFSLSKKENSPFDDTVLKIINLTNNDLSLSDCMKQGLWVYTIDDATAKHFGYEIKKDEKDEKYILENVVNELGKPTSIKRTDEFEIGSSKIINYDVIYEYDNFAVVFSVKEDLYKNAPESEIEIESCSYFSRELWDKEKENYDADELLK